MDKRSLTERDICTKFLSQSLLVDETSFHLEETQSEIVGPDMGLVLFYPENRTQRINPHLEPRGCA